MIQYTQWLLEREGKTIDDNGQVVPKPKDATVLPLFWRREQIPIATMNTKGISAESCARPSTFWYYNRLTGSLQEDMPLADDVPGAMLCEEMGLGN